MLYSIIIGVIVIICILLTIVVLLQSGQGQGLTGGLAASSGFSGTPMGARRTADILSKSTSVLGTALLVLCVLANFFIGSGETNQSAVQQSSDAAVPTDVNTPSQTPSAVPQQQSQNPNAQQPIPQQTQNPQQNNNSGGGSDSDGN